MELKGASGAYYRTGALIQSGAEGELHSVLNLPNSAIKIYRPEHASFKREQKIRYMISHPPRRLAEHIAWPRDVLAYNGRFAGFVMHRMPMDAEINHVYAYNPDHAAVSVRERIAVAANVCDIMGEVHNAGFVVGDFNHTNLGVKRGSATVSLVDADSFHIVDPSVGLSFRCNVCMDGYAAPELIEHCKKNGRASYVSAPLPTFTPATDRFALAIHIFRLLMNGVTPFNGVNDRTIGSGPTAFVGNKAIERDQYCFKRGNRPQSILCPPLSVLPRKIRGLFTRAFIKGRVHPQKRPSAAEWHAALIKYGRGLAQCDRRKNHQYSRHLSHCPWCALDAKV